MNPLFHFLRLGLHSLRVLLAKAFVAGSFFQNPNGANGLNLSIALSTTSRK